jgi:hypothetical protein
LTVRRLRVLDKEPGGQPTDITLKSHERRSQEA